MELNLTKPERDRLKLCYIFNKIPIFFNDRTGAQIEITNIKPNWTVELKNCQVQQDDFLAVKFAVGEAQQAGLTFFTNGRATQDEEKTRIIELQRKEIEYYNNLLKK